GDIPSKGLFDTVFNWNMKIKFGEIPFKFQTGSDRTRFIGENGWIEISRSAGLASNDPNQWGKILENKGLKASDPKLLQIPLEDREPILKRTQNVNHIDDFVRSIKEGKEPSSTLRDAVRSDNISHLCDIAVRTKSIVKWDPINMKLINPTPEQSKILSRTLREPWTL
ncbi:MAG: hypothetical protein LBC74_09305, partial [Planctomycetaceae bacterium]|nr:hypothetical protein [Planctomycetaceae bacterium]